MGLGECARGVPGSGMADLTPQEDDALVDLRARYSLMGQGDPARDVLKSSIDGLVAKAMAPPGGWGSPGDASLSSPASAQGYDAHGLPVSIQPGFSLPDPFSGPSSYSTAEPQTVWFPTHTDGRRMPSCTAPCGSWVVRGPSSRAR